MADDGLEVRPKMVKALAEFTNEDQSQSNDSNGPSRGGRNVTTRSRN